MRGLYPLWRLWICVRNYNRETVLFLADPYNQPYLVYGSRKNKGFFISIAADIALLYLAVIAVM
jgi:hypothetical protein